MRAVKKKRAGRTGRGRNSIELSILPLDESIGQLLRKAHRGVMRALDGRISQHGITTGIWFFLRVLWEKDMIPQSELSAQAGVMGPTTVTAVERMERMGLIERLSSTTDKRTTIVQLTPKGRRMKNALLPRAVEVVKMATSKLSAAEVRQLRDMLMRIVDAVEQDNA